MIIIKIFVPTYFKEFRCIADRCPDTCCAGWEVNLDPESAEYYRTVDGVIGDKLRSVLTKDEDGDDMFTLTECDRCPFLNKSNLCELILNLGEDKISKTCTLFPRFYDDFGSFREMGLGFGCPEAARILLEHDKPFSLVEYGDTNETAEDIDYEFLKFLIKLREKLFGILDNDELNFKEKIREILTVCRNVQCDIYGGECESTYIDVSFAGCIDVLAQMEFINDNRKNILLSLSDRDFDRNIFEKYRSDFEVLMKYYIFRYLLKAVYDDDVLTKVKYGVFACAVMGRLYKKEPDRVKAQYGYSKEVEYSDINLEILDNELYENFPSEGLIDLF